MAKYRNADDPRFVIQNWMRNRNTVEFLAVWEELHNPNFNRVQFEAVRSEAGLNRFVMTPAKWIEETNTVLFGMTAKEWRDSHSGEKGNIRDTATIYQLLVLANMESYNAILIKQEKTQAERMHLLHELAVQQMTTLSGLELNNLPGIEENRDAQNL